MPRVPRVEEVDGERKSATWTWLSLGTVQERLTTEDALELCKSADVVIVEQELSKKVLGLEPADLEAAFKGKTTCIVISPFSTDGPYSDYLLSRVARVFPDLFASTGVATTDPTAAGTKEGRRG